MTIAVDLGHKATKQTNKQNKHEFKSRLEYIVDPDQLAPIHHKPKFRHLTLLKSCVFISKGQIHAYAISRIL